MKAAKSLDAFASLIERNLPAVDDLHERIREAGFSAWEVFINERLKLLSTDEREEELRYLLLSCREEFCNFNRYTRDTAGDGLQLPILSDRREHARRTSPGEPIYLLRSDALMRADTSLAIKYASSAREAASAALRIERDRQSAAIKPMFTDRPAAPLGEYVMAMVAQRFKLAGFIPLTSTLKNAACFEKVLTPSTTVTACLDEIDSLGAAGWRGDIDLSFYVRPGTALEQYHVKTCCKNHTALPLRLEGLVPGLHAYKTGSYFLGASYKSGSLGDVVILNAYERHPESEESRSRVAAHVTLATNCLLTIFSLVDAALTAAAIEFEDES